MKAKKHVFHCNTCDSPCTIYKKGKTHRVLVCPNCGILASNPLPLLALAAPAALKAGKSLLSKGVSALSGKKSSEEQAPPAKQKIITDSLDLPNKNERYVKMALGGR